MDSKAEREFCEGRMQLIGARRRRDRVATPPLCNQTVSERIQLGAEVLIKVADAAERLLLHAGKAALSRGTT